MKSLPSNHLWHNLGNQNNKSCMDQLASCVALLLDLFVGDCLTLEFFTGFSFLSLGWGFWL